MLSNEYPCVNSSSLSTHDETVSLEASPSPMNRRSFFAMVAIHLQSQKYQTRSFRVVFWFPKSLLCEEGRLDKNLRSNIFGTTHKKCHFTILYYTGRLRFLDLSLNCLYCSLSFSLLFKVFDAAVLPILNASARFQQPSFSGFFWIVWKLLLEVSEFFSLKCLQVDTLTWSFLRLFTKHRKIFVPISVNTGVVNIWIVHPGNQCTANWNKIL